MLELKLPEAVFSAMLEKPVVLLVEDEPLILLHVQLALEDDGFDVLTANNSQTALSHLEEQDEIDALLTDVDIPGPIDGVELATRVIRSRPGTLVFITSGSDDPARLTIPTGANFVRKPYTATQMSALVRQHRAATA